MARRPAPARTAEPRTTRDPAPNLAAKQAAARRHVDARDLPGELTEAVEQARRLSGRRS